MKKFEQVAAGVITAALSVLLVTLGGAAAQAAEAGPQLAQTGADGFLVAAGIVAALLVLGTIFMLLRNRRMNADSVDDEAFAEPDRDSGASAS